MKFHVSVLSGQDHREKRGGLTKALGFQNKNE